MFFIRTTFFTLLILLLTAQFKGQHLHKKIEIPLPHQQAVRHWIDVQNGRWDTSSGVPRTLYNVHTESFLGTPEEAARTYLEQNLPLFKMTPGLPELKATQVQVSPAGYHVRFLQYLQGLPVYNADVVVSLNKNNSVTFVSNNYKPALALKNNVPSVTSEEAERVFLDYLNVRGKVFHQEGPTLMIYAEEQTPRLVYRIWITTDNPRGDWEGFVDAVTGEIVTIQDRMMYSIKRNIHPEKTTTGTGYIWNPDPLTSASTPYGTSGFVDNNDADSPQLNEQRVLASLRDISFSGGTYKLIGPHVRVEDWDAPTQPVVTASDPDSFRYTRTQSGFEDVMVYFHIDNAQRYLQSLGFFNIQNTSIWADPHGVNGEDNSYYSPGLNRLSFGEGGTDDAEDADVILHEYGHAIQYGIVYGWGGSGNGNEQGALGEGFSDYWAGSYSRALNNTFSRNFVFTWDAGFNGVGGTIWPGRRLNFPHSYPDTGVSRMQVHYAGQYWSSVLMLIYDDLGREITDKIVVQSHYYLGTFATMRDNAAAVIRANRDLYGGAHVNQIALRFLQRNFLLPAKISHTPLRDTENLAGPYPVNVTITQGFFPLAPQGVKVFWGRNSAITDSIALTQSGPGVYTGTIPGNDSAAVYCYYITAQDQTGYTSVSPPSAPTQLYTFYAGTDTVPPIAEHSPLPDQAKRLWAPILTVIAKDNIGVDSVWVECIRQRNNLYRAFPLSRTNDTTFQAPFPLDTSEIVIGDSIFYKIYVKDISSSGNLTILPDSGYYAFKITLIKILIGSLFSSSTPLLYSTLKSLPYEVDSVKWTTVAPSIIPRYDLIILTGGVNTAPIFPYRTNIINHITNGGKVWVEGGNVGFFFRLDGTRDIDPHFRRQVLNTDIWIADATISNIVILQPTHKIFTMPHIISSPIQMTTFTPTGDRDAMRMLSNTGVSRLASMSEYSYSAAIIVYTPPHSITPASVFTTFALSSITDTLVAQKLIENIVTTFYPPESTTSVQEEATMVPDAFSLKQNYPNPFNPTTTITFTLPQASFVSLKVFNLLGQEVATLVNEKKNAGTHTLKFDGTGLASGVYFYRIIAGDFVETKKFVLIK